MLISNKAQRGASGLTYGLLVGLVGIVALAAVQTSGSSVNSLMSETGDTLGSVVEASPTPTPLPDPPIVSLTSTAPISTNFGASITLTGTASGEEVSLQWHLDGSPVAGATTDTLVINPVTQDDLGSYELVATNPGGSTTSGSRTVSAAITYTSFRSQQGSCAFTSTSSGVTSFNGAAAHDNNGGTSITVSNDANRTFCSCYIADFGPVRVASVFTDVRFGVSTGGRSLRLKRTNGSLLTIQSQGVLANTSSVATTINNSEPGTLMNSMVLCYNGIATAQSARRLFVDELRVNLAP